MKYIIMCGTNNPDFNEPRQLTKINDEPIVARTIRLLREEGIDDIAISSNDPRFDGLGVEVLHHKNTFNYWKHIGRWVEAFYPTDEPTCYLFGDVVYSRHAIQTIINGSTADVEFFASAPPFAKNYIKRWAEPLAFKVVDQKHFKESIQLVKDFAEQGLFRREPIAWELWQVIKQTPLNQIDYTNYTVINDYSCDIDEPLDAVKLQERINECQDT